jgi:tetratricopeptide (TPR) repeat protein
VEALAAYERSIADMENMGRQGTTRNAIRYNNFSRVLFIAGQSRRAAEMAGRGLAIVRSGTEANTLNAILEANQARALVELGRNDEAKALTEHALELATQRKDIRWAGTIALYGAPAWCATGAVERCAELLDTARGHLTASLPKGHVNFGVLEIATAQLALARRQPADAREPLQRAGMVFSAAAEKSPLQWRALGLLARTEVQLGDAAAAAGHADAAVAAAREAARGLASSAWLGEALVTLALVRQAQGDKGVAAAALREAVEQLQGALGDEAPALVQARALLVGS